MSTARYFCHILFKKKVIISKNVKLQNFMKILSVGADLVHNETETNTNGRTNITKPIVAFRKSVNAPISK